VLSKKTAIGIGIGSFAVAIGAYFLISGIIFHDHKVDEPVYVNKNDVFQFDAQKHFHETLNVTGNSFHVKITTPTNYLPIDHDFKNEISFDWYILEDGQHIINITNTGNSTLHVTGILEASTNNFETMSHLIVITSGIIIIGISAAFTIRKPRGF